MVLGSIKLKFMLITLNYEPYTLNPQLFPGYKVELSYGSWTLYVGLLLNIGKHVSRHVSLSFSPALRCPKCHSHNASL